MMVKKVLKTGTHQESREKQDILCLSYMDNLDSKTRTLVIPKDELNTYNVPFLIDSGK